MPRLPRTLPPRPDGHPPTATIEFSSFNFGVNALPLEVSSSEHKTPKYKNG